MTSHPDRRGARSRVRAGSIVIELAEVIVILDDDQRLDEHARDCEFQEHVAALLPVDACVFRSHVIGL